ncbi:MAG: hypothetical protein ACRC2R_03670 [Xenococcaceae cyanobacterium]
MNNQFLAIAIGICFGFIPQVVSALPPPEDKPEEILRNEIITEARSPLDGKPLTAAQYAQLQTELAKNPFPSPVSSNIKETIFLLNIRKLFKTFTPF